MAIQVKGAWVLRVGGSADLGSLCGLSCSFGAAAFGLSSLFFGARLTSSCECKKIRLPKTSRQMACPSRGTFERGMQYYHAQVGLKTESPFVPYKKAI